jgi:hypothetical protein
MRDWHTAACLSIYMDALEKIADAPATASPESLKQTARQANADALAYDLRSSDPRTS